MKKIFFLTLFLSFLSIFILSLLIIKGKVIKFPRAKTTINNIIIDNSFPQGEIKPFWQALAQGGEEKYPFDSVFQEIYELEPKYIRIDHLYDFYNVVNKKNNQLIFNWSELDRIVDQITSLGAIPFLSLSYMPPIIAQEGNLINPPVNWEDWTEVVRKTIEHYSGRAEKNLTNVCYEVWNEPDLFGNWKIGGKRDYRLLYKYAVLGANQAKNTNPFKIGGPAITNPYKNWVDGFLDFIKENNLRIDFYSWHRYSLKPGDFKKDIDLIDLWLFKNSGYSLEKYITEWGSNSEISPLHDSEFDAAHLVVVISQLLHRVDLGFTFEIKDGPSPQKEKFWGRWGLLTHEVGGLPTKKPKYYALKMLNQMKGNQLKTEGLEDGPIYGFATKNQNNIKVILTNFDQNYSQLIFLTFNNLENGNYLYQEEFLNGQKNLFPQAIEKNFFKKQLLLSPNEVVLIKIEKS